jgi:choline dehydrogenase
MFNEETRWTPAYLLDSSIKPNNVDVLPNTPIDRVLFNDAKQVIGVLTADGKTIKCNEVLLTNGSLGVPAILQRSGIGPEQELKRLGIPIVVANDEVGHGVDHIEIPVTHALPPNSNANEEMTRGGPMAWPIVMFFDGEFMAHFGISPPPYNSGDEITATPNHMLVFS